jgi:hypothetical protein
MVLIAQQRGVKGRRRGPKRIMTTIGGTGTGAIIEATTIGIVTGTRRGNWADHDEVTSDD